MPISPDAENAAFTLCNPQGLCNPRVNAYSHVASVNAGARMLFVAGQGGEDQQGRLSADFTEQAIQALANVETALQSQGASLAQVFKLTLLIVDHNEQRLHSWVEQANRVWGTGRHPACTLIPVPRLAMDNMLIEIEAIATA
ncbi:RidA family protein [Pseudomonas alliivorans]|uniref:RidA family protein n=1 Tax=Pseudomonas alliivorans TaxID=2810613 RepID=A0ABS4C5E2_9PSED|nr:RidA family protein [Pseudomonas alliivorans]MBP0945800.1 RidA family protein [Pseudomonas alliivorans]MEE4326321.1 RidA family protein [Pseudomonas alliivorans]MEE4367851.1 RidA family protein [Pseudomonas alliivorans]MEE4919854.1 RidA family protein [Pseudomonas alliivorans]MEE4944811.1 RidA family protein [Pseudomonas alliivorans]